MNSKYLLVIILLLVVATWDVLTRLSQEQAINQHNGEQIISELVMPFSLSAQQKSDITKQYQHYNPNAELSDVNQNESKGMSAELQGLQQGELDQLYSGDLRIRLGAVIRQPTEQKVFAVLSVVNVNDDKHTIEQMKLGESVYGYKLLKIELDQIKLVSITDSNRSIILPIYQMRKQSYKQEKK